MKPLEEEEVTSPPKMQKHSVGQNDTRHLQAVVAEGSSNQLQDKNCTWSLTPPAVHREPLHKDKSQNLQTMKSVPMKFHSPPAGRTEVTEQTLLSFMNSCKKVPLFVLLPELQRLLIGDRHMELCTLIQLFENDEIAANTFIREIATLRGPQLLLLVVDKMLKQAARGEVPGQHNMQFPLNVQVPALYLALDMNDIHHALGKDTFQWRTANIQDQRDKRKSLNLSPASSSTNTHKAVNAVSQPNATVMSNTERNRAARKRRVFDCLEAEEVPHVSHEDAGPSMPISCSRTALVELQSQYSCSNKALEGVNILQDLLQKFCKNLDEYKIAAGKVMAVLNLQVIADMKSLQEERETLRIQNKALKEKLSEAQKQMEESELRGKLNYISSEEHKEDMRSYAKRMKPS